MNQKNQIKIVKESLIKKGKSIEVSADQLVEAIIKLIHEVEDCKGFGT